MSDSLIPSFLVSNVSESLRSLTKNERCERIAQVAHQKWAMLANRSGRSPKMSDHEWFAHIAQRKWAIVSESLRSLTKNEWMSESLVLLSKSLIRSFLGKKRVICLEKPMSEFPALHLRDFLTVSHFWWVTWGICSQLLICPERPERFAHIANYKRVNDWIACLFKNIKIWFYSNFLSESLFLWAKEQMSDSLKNEQFAHSLICPERFTHSCSFVLSNLSKWAMSEWANSQP